MRKAVHKDALKGLVGCLVLALLIFILALIAMKMGSITITYRELFEGLFVAYDKRVATIYDLRFPRIIVWQSLLSPCRTFLLVGSALLWFGLPTSLPFALLSRPARPSTVSPVR